jgi:myo-inositol 2-dehydrogenase / D-chiro-inositol 1-dehydrogenase
MATNKLVATSLAALPIERFAHAAGGDELKLALVGCGGRGAGAASQALTADSNMKLVAVADAFPDKLAVGLKSLQAAKNELVDVPAERQFAGLDGFKHAIAASDVVILATPCAFRPAHFEEAVRQGKHVFLEKPVAVDAPGIRRVLAAAEEAKRKGLKVAVGFQRRHKEGFQELVKRIHDGQIGRLIHTRSYADTPLRTGIERKPEWSELEYQLRNWYYFSWLSGDFLVDNLVHGIDISNWIHRGYPVRCQGMGGLTQRTKEYGNLFDHFSCQWEYESGAHLFGECHRFVGAWVSVTNHATGTEGEADFIDGREIFTITGQRPWRMPTDRKQNPYQQEHDDFFAAIRADRPYHEADYGARSTLTAIMGRMAAYSGKLVTWEEAVNSELRLAPDITSLEDAPPVTPDGNGLYEIPLPGRSIAL